MKTTTMTICRFDCPLNSNSSIPSYITNRYANFIYNEICLSINQQSFLYGCVFVVVLKVGGSQSTYALSADSTSTPLAIVNRADVYICNQIDVPRLTLYTLCRYIYKHRKVYTAPIKCTTTTHFPTNKS